MLLQQAGQDKDIALEKVLGRKIVFSISYFLASVMTGKLEQLRTINYLSKGVSRRRQRKNRGRQNQNTQKQKHKKTQLLTQNNKS